MYDQEKSPALAEKDTIPLVEIVKSGLCSGCGACVAVCPQAAISIDHPRSYKPTIQKSQCTRCNQCYRVCPGKGWPDVD